MLTLSATASPREGIHSAISFDTSARVSRGGVTEIPLTAVPNFGNTISFEIQIPPEHGVLSKPVNHSDHQAVVIYHHDGSGRILEDEFTFKVKSAGLAKSISYRARISIIPSPAGIVFQPLVLNFGAVTVSENSQRQVTISNSGGSRLNAKLLFPRGYSSECDVVMLNENESTNIAIIFSPMETGEISGEVATIPDVGKESLHLRGCGQPRFVVTKCGAVEWEIRNQSTNSIRINATGGDGWLMPPEMLITPKTTQVISFHQLEVDDGVVNNTNRDIRVQLSDGLSSNEIELPQPKRFIPITVQQISPETLGTLILGGSVPISFRIQNRSEFPKQVTWNASSTSGGCLSKDNAIKLRGGEMREITFNWTPTVPGNALLKLFANDGSKSKQSLLWKVKVFNESSNQHSGDLPSTIPSIQENNEVRPTGETPLPTKQLSAIQEITWGIKTSWSGERLPFLEWKAGDESPSRVVVEDIILVPTKGSDAFHQHEEVHVPPLTVKSVPLAVSGYKLQADHEKISILRISPGSHLITIKLYKKGNADPESCSSVQLTVPPRASWWSRFKTPFCLIALAILILLFRAMRR